jgi:hypothetical protein
MKSPGARGYRVLGAGSRAGGPGAGAGIQIQIIAFEQKERDYLQPALGLLPLGFC